MHTCFGGGLRLLVLDSCCVCAREDEQILMKERLTITTAQCIIGNVEFTRSRQCVMLGLILTAGRLAFVHKGLVLCALFVVR